LETGVGGAAPVSVSPEMEMVMDLCWRVFPAPFWCWIWCVGVRVMDQVNMAVLDLAPSVCVMVLVFVLTRPKG
jgi:hypothetical protein